MVISIVIVFSSQVWRFEEESGAKRETTEEESRRVENVLVIARMCGSANSEGDYCRFFFRFIQDVEMFDLDVLGMDLYLRERGV